MNLNEVLCNGKQLNLFILKIYVFLITVFVFFSCVEFELEISSMTLYPVVNTETNYKSGLDGWWRSEFQADPLNFIMYFSYTGFTGSLTGKYYINDFPDENTVIITCNKDVYSDSDTIRAGELLNECFFVQKYNPIKFSFYFLVSEKQTNKFLFDEQYYTFNFIIKSTKNNTFTDSCIIKRF